MAYSISVPRSTLAMAGMYWQKVALPSMRPLSLGKI